MPTNSSNINKTDGSCLTAVPKIFNIIFLVDNSENMEKEGNLYMVNQTFRLMIPKFQEFQEVCGLVIMISIMAFNENPKWLVTPTEINHYIHSDIQAGQGEPYFSHAFEELDQKLSRNQFMNHQEKMARSYIMLITGDRPSLEDDYEVQIKKLKKNNWFHAALKYAALIGKDTIHDSATRQAVSSFVDGNDECIINITETLDVISDLIMQICKRWIYPFEYTVGADAFSLSEENPWDIILSEKTMWW